MTASRGRPSSTSSATVSALFTPDRAKDEDEPEEEKFKVDEGSILDEDEEIAEDRYGSGEEDSEIDDVRREFEHTNRIEDIIEPAGL